MKVGIFVNINKLELNNYNNVAFKANYKLRVHEKHLRNFEQHVAPMFENYYQQPIGAIFDNGILSVFTGKKDIELFKKMRARLTHDLASLKILSQSELEPLFENRANKYVKRTILNTDSNTYDMLSADTNFEHLTSFKELLKKLFGN